jgi:putative transposase
MPYRTKPFVTGEIYHIYNRTIASQPLFLCKKDYDRFIDLVWYYRYVYTPYRYSIYYRLSTDARKTICTALEKNNETHCEILAFTQMPNHYHFLIRQHKELGIHTFISNLQNSYAKYFDTKSKRSGSLFQAMFKGKRIETDEQLIHLMRYIHLNTVTSYIHSNIDQLALYPYSSYGTHQGTQHISFVSTSLIRKFFSSPDEFVTFHKDQTDYQRKLAYIRHLTWD